MTRDLNLEDNIIFTGKTSWDEMSYYYQAADVFATASKTETQGLTVIEAMASNVVPVCMKDEAFESMITDELNGLVFKDQEEYEKLILRLYDNPNELERLDKQARIQAESYSSKFYADKVLAVYQRAIKEKEEENRFGIISKIARNIKERLK